MFIENSDAFKVWLTSVLEPLCDADPEALAKYVFALVKKDKPLEELRECMIEQLDVFLQSETKPFVELLFKTLDSQEYLNNSHVIPNTNPPNPNVPANANTIKRDGIGGSPKPPETLILKEMKPIIPVSTLPNLSEAINGAVKTTKNDEGVVGAVVSTVKRDVRKSDSEKDDVTSRGRSTRTSTSTRHRSSSRNRSRSRSWDRSGKRSRSRDRSPRIERRDRSRPWRNKSPPRRYERERERRRSRSGSPRVRSRSRSPRHSSYRIGGRYRNRSPPQRSISRSRSRSNERTNTIITVTAAAADVTNRTKQDKMKEDNSGGATPTQDSNHGDTDMRLINTAQSIQSVVSAGEGFAGPPGKRRCRDFDEKGYCMRGEMCPYDHGVDPVVLEDTALSRVLTFGPNGAPPDGAAAAVAVPPPPGAAAIGPPGLMNPQMVVAMPGGGGGGFHQHRGASMLHSGVEYNPSAPGMLYHHRPGFRPRGPPPLRGGGGGSLLMHNNNNNGGGGGPGPGPFGQSIQRELINVPVMDGPNTMGYKRRSDYAPQDVPPPMKKRQGGFDFNRLGPRALGGGGGGGGGPLIKNPANCSLELKKVPRGMNNITHLNNHFAKFGKIVNIQVCFEGDPEGAIVTFSSHAEANAAYRSTEAVLNNRFIKVFWHTNNTNTNNNNNNNNNSNNNNNNITTSGSSSSSSSNNNATGENIPPTSSHNNGQQVRGPAKERLGQQAVLVNTNKVLNLVQPKADDVDNKRTSTTNVYVPSLVVKKLEQQKEDSRALAHAAIVKNQEILAAKEQLKKKHEEKRKEALKITQDLRKRKQELLEKQLAQQKLLIEKLEKTNPSGQQREILMSTIKTVQESIESIRKDMLNQTVAPATVAGVPPLRKSKEEAQREVLDAELDLITRQQEGGDTSDLQRRLMELRAQAYSLTRIGGGPMMPGAGGGPMRRGRGALRGATRHHHHHHHHPHFHLLTKNNMTLDNTMKRASIGPGALTSNAANKKTVIDHRPTRLLVSGYEADEYESVLAHFSQYGDICEYVMDDSTPSIILSYRTRKEAEIAVLKGKHFQDRTLSVTWCTDIQFNTVKRATNSTTVTLIPNEPEESESGLKTELEQEQEHEHEHEHEHEQEQEQEQKLEQEQEQKQQLQLQLQLEPEPEPRAEQISDQQQAEKQMTAATVSTVQTKETDDEVTLNTTEDQLLEGDDENISGEQLGTELSEEVLLQDDEEDIEEDEERSWRR